MAKVLLVEDDNNLREIYQARLTAEGYDIVTAQNGEEALVVAKQNKPDLIISDVMMPRISGFEMLDILRNTDELKHTRVIMLTALGQGEDQKRANSLGTDKYLVKSQVTLEDIVNAAKELLSEDGAVPPAAPAPSAQNAVAPAASGIAAITDVPDPNPAPAPVQPNPAATAIQPPVPPAGIEPAAPQQSQPEPPAAPPATTPVEPSAAPIDTPTGAEHAAVAPTEEPVAVEPEPTPAGPTTPATPPEQSKIDSAAQGLEAEEAALQAQIASYSAPAADTNAPDANASNDQAIAEAVEKLNTPGEPAQATPPSAENAPATPSTAPVPPPASTSDNVTVAGKKIIRPISDPTTKPDLNALLAKEEAKDAFTAPAAAPVVNGAPAQAPAPTPPATPGQAFDPTTSL